MIVRAAVLGIAWLIAVAWRPFVLGLYHDDWCWAIEGAGHGGPFSWQRLAYILYLDLGRPVNAFCCYLASSWCGRSPFLLQLNSALAVLLAGWSIAALLDAAGRLYRPAAAPRWASVRAAVLWFVLPWTFGSTAWPVAFPIVVGLALFCLSGALLFDGWARNRPAAALPAFLYLASCLCYEATYFQFAVLFLFGAVTWPGKRAGSRAFIRPLAAFLIAQTAAIAWNRLCPYLAGNATIAKHFNAGWLPLFLLSLGGLKAQLLSSAPECHRALAWLVRAAVGLGGAAAVAGLLSRRRRTFALRCLAGLSFCVLGVLLSIWLYSIAGYQVVGRGIFSRTTLVLSLWLIVAVWLFDLLAKEVWPRIGAVAAGLVAIAAACLLVASLGRVRDWAEAWRLEKEIIAAAPVRDLASTGPLAIIVLSAPAFHQEVPVFAATWDISAAMNNSYPELRLADDRRGLRPSGWRLFTVQREWVSAWDGRSMTQGPPPDGKPAHWTLRGDEVWLWRYPDRRLVRVRPPLVLGGPNPVVRAVR